MYTKRFKVMEIRPPVLIVTYNRPNSLENILNQSFAYGVRIFYVAVDGAKNNLETDLSVTINQVIDKFSSKNSIKIKIWYRDDNLGLTKSMLSAIDWFFSNESRGIILEDDLHLTKSFFDFTQMGLQMYESNKKVFMISGNQFSGLAGDVSGVSVANYPLIWGWATWSNRWSEFRINLDQFKVPKNEVSIKKNTYFFWRLGYLRSMYLQNQSWAILLATYLRFSNYISVMPNSNLVSNIGFGTGSTNTLVSNESLQKAAVEQRISIFEIENARNLNTFIEKNVYNISLKHYFLFVKILNMRLRTVFFDGSLINALNLLAVKSFRDQR